MSEHVTVAFAPAPVEAEFAEGKPTRTIRGLAVPFGVASGPDSLTGRRYTFAGPPTNADELVDVVRGHDDDAVVGRLASPWEPTDDGLPAAARIFATTAGNDTLEEVRESVITGFSLSAAVNAFTEDADGIRHVTEWSARHLGLVRRPAFTQSAGLQLAASAHTEENPTMPEQNQQVVELPTVAELAEQVAQHMAELKTEPTSPLAQFETLHDFVAALDAADEEEQARLQAAFVLSNQITGDNPGLMPPGWRRDLKANLDARRPAITAMGGSIGLPDAGMDSNWPYYDGDLDAIVAQQATQKSELNSVKVSIKKGTAPIKTAGAASDISYQLLRRSSPSYLEAYLRILNAAWARYTEARFEAALAAAATPLGEAVGTTASAIRGQLFAASSEVEDATGAPADTVLVAKDLWTAWGALEGLHNPKYGTQNTAGTADASNLRININGLEVRRAPFLEAGTALVSNGQAAKFAEQGPMVATEEDVAKLGRDVAIWGMYEDAEVYFPNGIVSLAAGGTD